MLKPHVPIELVLRSPYRPVSPPVHPREVAAFLHQGRRYDPMVVRETERQGTYELLIGESTWRLLQAAGIHTADVCLMQGVDDDLAKIMARSDAQADAPGGGGSDAPLTKMPGMGSCAAKLSIAEAILALTEEGEMRLTAAAGRFGLSATEAAHYRRVLTLPDAVLAHGRRGDLSFGQLRALSRLAAHGERVKRLAEEIVRAERGSRYRRASSMTVRRIEQRVQQVLAEVQGQMPPSSRHAKPPDTESNPSGAPDNRVEEQRLTESCGHVCKIHFDAKSTSGWLSIRFCDLEEYDLVAGIIAPQAPYFD